MYYILSPLAKERNRGIAENFLTKRIIGYL